MISITIPVAFVETDMQIFKFLLKNKGSRLGETTLKKNKVGQLKLPDFKIFFIKYGVVPM